MSLHLAICAPPGTRLDKPLNPCRTPSAGSASWGAPARRCCGPSAATPVVSSLAILAVACCISSCRGYARGHQLRRRRTSLPERGMSMPRRAVVGLEGNKLKPDLRAALTDLVERSEAVLAAEGVGTAAWRKRRAELNKKACDPNVWSDTDKGLSLTKELRQMDEAEKMQQQWQHFAEDAEAALDLAAVATSEEARELRDEAQQALSELLVEVERQERQILMSGRYDSYSCRLSIFAGVGGDAACDWAAMLHKMYVAYAEARGWKVRCLHATPAPHTGRSGTRGWKSIEVEITGDYAFGTLRGEHGAHTLKRLSDCGSTDLKQTQVAGVMVAPVLLEDDLTHMELKAGDLKYQGLRGGSSRGPHADKLESACRVVHEPTGVTAECREHKTLSENKASALKKLKEKLLLLKARQYAAEIEAASGESVNIGMGSTDTIRRYQLQGPCRMVKDTRSGYETSDVIKVLRGGLDPLIEAYLRWQATSATSSL